jgi:hypothetical protein
MATRAAERVLTDHGEIRRWAEARGAKPACVQGTERHDGSCVLRLDFPGYSGEQTLAPVPWDHWFRVFEERRLALVVEDRMPDGAQSNFNKLVSREAVRSQG